MSCGYGTVGFQCDQMYDLGETVGTKQMTDAYTLGQKLGLTEFNPTSVDWERPYEWAEDGQKIMSYGMGLLIMLGFGGGLTVITFFLVIAERKFAGIKNTSEHFNTASREVKTGLTASVIVSQWTWAATLLQSSNVAWQYGITGPFWYAAGASIQVLLFGILAIYVKINAPNAHTFLEMVKVRWGKQAHFVFLFFALCTNLIVSSMLLLGGCACMNAVAGIHIGVSSFLIPALVLLYTFFGGLKATFLASYLHTTIIFIGLMTFVSIVYGGEMDCSDTSKQCTSLGSASIVWERLRFITAMPLRVGTHVNAYNETTVFHQGPAFPTRDGNRQGSYLTMMSQPGLMFGIINIVGNFGTVFVDQSYWQSAIAASPASAHKGYLLGGLVWFTIPFALATSLGLAGNALNVKLSSDDAGAGLVPPASAIAMLGPFGGYLMIIMLFMAIISTGSAECIAVSSLWSYDIYRTYLNPNATGAQVLMQSRIVVCVWALVMAIASIVLNAFTIGLGWVYNFMGICIGSAVVPIALCVLDKRLDAKFAMLAAVAGFLCAVTVWLVVGYSIADADTVIFKDVTGQLNAQLAGNLTAIGSSAIICAIGSIVSPQNFDFEIMKTGITLVGGDGGEKAKVLGAEWESRPEFLEAAKNWIVKYGCGLTIFLVFWWPLAAVPFGMFGKSTFQLWAAIALCWGIAAGMIIICLPLLENRAIIMKALTCTTVELKEEEKSEVASA